MTQHRTRFLVVSLVLSALFSAASWLAAQARRDAPEPDSRYKYESVFHEALQRVREAYVNEVDDHELMAGAYEGAADALGAFAVYVAAWLATVALFGIACGLLFALLGTPQMLGVAALPGGLLFSTAFYVSLYFTYADCFGQSGDAQTTLS